jgi:hypothetical protein
MAIRHNEAAPRRARTWQGRLRHRISWTLLIKLLALLALWLLFFSPAHRISVTPDAVDTVIAVDAAPAPVKALAEGRKHDD